MIIAIYLFLCVVIGLLGLGGRLGFFWNFVLSILLTPLVMLIAHIIRHTFERNSVKHAQEIIDKYNRRHGLKA